MNNIREYNGYFMFETIGGEQMSQIARIFVEEDFEVDLSHKSLEFESTGRDDDRLVIKMFKEVAKVLFDAEGELRCEIDDEQDDPHFEFFSIKRGQLWLQRGHIVREVESRAV